MAFFDSEKSRLYVAQYDLTSFTSELSGLPGPRQLREVTTWGDGGTKWHPGIQAANASWSGFYDDTSVTGTDVALSAFRGQSAANVLSFFPDPTVGAIGHVTEDLWQSDQTYKTRVGEMVQVSVSWEAGKVRRTRSLGPLVTKTATSQGTSIDDSASSASGGSWAYHITAFSASGGNARWQIILEDSADNSSFATVASENPFITAVGGALRTFTGTLRRYVRVEMNRDATSGSIEFIASYERG
jgi:hypothetical protein